MVEVLGHGVYTFPDAARLTRLRTARVREWFLPRQSRRTVPAIFESDYSGETEESIISFLDLIEVFVAGQLRERGISLQKVRKVHAALSAQLKTDHPFCRKEIRTRGKSVFAVGLDQRGRDEIFEVLTGQKVFPQIIRPFLKSLDYHSQSLLASRWKIARGVVVNPEICFGQPIVESAGIPTSILCNSYRANGRDLGIVAKWYGLTTEEVQVAVRFERKIAA
jgi:uncharacterized protein (DUF433 family)